VLRALRVSDLAIIDSIELVLEPGFNVVTGETGAGKSILLQALDVALGGRPEADLVRAGSGSRGRGALRGRVGRSASAPRAGVAAGGDGQPLVRRVIGRADARGHA
jgi:DNA repair protein RecN (Recombination protein N)